MLGRPGAHACVILVLCGCIWNAAAVSLVLPNFDDAGSLGFPLRQVVYPPGSTLGGLPPISLQGIGRLS